MINVDAMTAALLESHFEVQPTATGLYLRAARRGFEARRRLLGRSGAFVGRVRELGLLTRTFITAASEDVAGVVLVIAPAGSGKSRLRQEFLDWVAARPERAEVLFATADSMASGSPFAVLGQALRHAAAAPRPLRVTWKFETAL